MNNNEHETGIIRLIRLPDLITILNILFGFTAILLVLNNGVDSAIVLILAAALADGMDGAVARRVEFGVFGEHLDSFADAISFGIAPAVIYYAVASSDHHAIVCAFSAAYLICGILRLVRFGILDDPEFRGLPITAAGTFAVLLLYLVDSPYLVTGVFAILSVLMISNIRYPKGEIAYDIGAACCNIYSRDCGAFHRILQLVCMDSIYSDWNLYDKSTDRT